MEDFKKVPLLHIYTKKFLRCHINTRSSDLNVSYILKHEKPINNLWSSDNIEYILIAIADEPKKKRI